MRQTLALLTLFLGVLASNANATTRTWPGVSPCDAALQMCINASADNDVVEVATNATITESANVSKPFTLRAAAGYRPVLASGYRITGNLNVAGTANWTVEGFSLQSGYVSLTISGGTQVNAVIRRIHVDEAYNGSAEISVVNMSSSTATVSYDLSENVLNYFWDTNDGALRAALQVLDRGTGSTKSRIRENRITATGAYAIGILVVTQDRTHRTEILGNQVLGGRYGSIYVWQGSRVSLTGGTLDAVVFNNVVRSSTPGERLAAGIKFEMNDGSATLRAWHNTVVDAYRGVDILAASDALSVVGSVRANVFAYLSSYGLYRYELAASVADSDNLYYQTTETPATPGRNPNSVFADPLLKRVPDDPHLLPGSPAIDHLPASTLTDVLSAESLPFTDGDGLRRVKRANTAAATATELDLGALEAGDVTFLHRVADSLSVTDSPLDHNSVNGIPDAHPIATSNFNPDSGTTGIANDHPVSLRYVAASSRWQMREEDVLYFPPGARFNIFAPAVGVGRYWHEVNAGNVFSALTTLDHPGLNFQPGRIVLALRNPGAGPASIVPAPVATGYVSEYWRIVRLDMGPMPADGGFNVYFQEPSINAYLHQTSMGNLSGSVTLLDHPLLNGSPCARFHVTPSLNGSELGDHNIAVAYAGAPVNRWMIFNQDLAVMPSNVLFNVVVDPEASASSACVDAIFADGFE